MNVPGDKVLNFTEFLYDSFCAPEEESLLNSPAALYDQPVSSAADPLLSGIKILEKLRE